MKQNIKRNDPCPCGSGKKYKNCHENKDNKNTNKVPWILGIIFIIALGILFLKPNQSLKSSGGKPGQVWSEEHGHWHDAPSGKAPLPASSGQKMETPGESRQGKVWSEEHGHWHDAPTTNTTPEQEKSIQPPGPAPEGKVWSEEHGHWHDVPTTSNTPEQVKSVQPPGPIPEGKVWSEEHGHWHNDTTKAQSQNQ